MVPSHATRADHCSHVVWHREHGQGPYIPKQQHKRNMGCSRSRAACPSTVDRYVRACTTPAWPNHSPRQKDARASRAGARSAAPRDSRRIASPPRRADRPGEARAATVRLIGTRQARRQPRLSRRVAAGARRGRVRTSGGCARTCHGAMRPPRGRRSASCRATLGGHRWARASRTLPGKLAGVSGAASRSGYARTYVGLCALCVVAW